MVRYADDFIVLAADETEAAEAHRFVGERLADLALRYEPAKTRLANFAESFTFLGVVFEDGWYWYTWEDKRIEVRDDEADWLFGDYLPEY